MNGIYYKEGIYVLIDNDEKNDICVYHYDNKTQVSLYGGRVQIKGDDFEWAYLNVDGISIVKIKSKSIESSLELFEIISHLNAMEANGVDAFIEHYKQSIEFAYDELKELKKETEFQLTSESDESLIKSLKSELKKLKDLLFAVFALLFSLHTFMSAGLENEKVISVCQSIMDTLA
jgi:hypothetical protein